MIYGLDDNKLDMIDEVIIEAFATSSSITDDDIYRLYKELFRLMNTRAHGRDYHGAREILGSFTRAVVEKYCKKFRPAN